MKVVTFYGCGRWAGMTVRVQSLPDGSRLYSVNGGPFVGQEALNV